MHDVLEPPVSDLVSIGQGDPGQSHAFGHFRDGERERRIPCTSARDDVRVARNQPLRSILGRLDAVASIQDDQLHLRPSKSDDATLGIDILDRKLGADTHQLSIARYGTGYRRNQSDLDLWLLSIRFGQQLGPRKRRTASEQV